MALKEAWTTEATPEPTGADRAAVKATILDYFEGWYEAEPARMARALHPLLAKRSFAQDIGRTAALSTASAEQMIAWTAAGAGRAREGGVIDIQLADISGGIASAIVTSESYVEYLHLVRVPDGWRIVNALWRWADDHGPASD
jgi:hypothetical protein